MLFYIVLWQSYNAVTFQHYCDVYTEIFITSIKFWKCSSHLCAHIKDPWKEYEFRHELTLTFSPVTRANTILQKYYLDIFSACDFFVFSRMREFKTAFPETSETVLESMEHHQSNNYRGSNSDREKLLLFSAFATCTCQDFYTKYDASAPARR